MIKLITQDHLVIVKACKTRVLTNILDHRKLIVKKWSRVQPETHFEVTSFLRSIILVEPERKGSNLDYTNKRFNNSGFVL